MARTPKIKERTNLLIHWPVEFDGGQEHRWRGYPGASELWAISAVGMRLACSSLEAYKNVLSSCYFDVTASSGRLHILSRIPLWLFLDTRVCSKGLERDPENGDAEIDVVGGIMNLEEFTEEPPIGLCRSFSIRPFSIPARMPLEVVTVASDRYDAELPADELELFLWGVWVHEIL